jgi:hypothetical protein
MKQTAWVIGGAALLGAIAGTGDVRAAADEPAPVPLQSGIDLQYIDQSVRPQADF